MFFSRLSMLDGKFTGEEIKQADEYFASLSPAAANMITVSKISGALEWDYEKSSNFVKHCIEIGFMKKRFGCNCPRCGLLISEVESLQQFREEPPFCPYCDEEIDIDEIDYGRDLVLLYSILDTAPPFRRGQQMQNNPGCGTGESVAHPDSLVSGVVQKLVTYDELFHPTKEQYDILEELIKQIEGPHATTAQKGRSLEKFVATLFNCCLGFRVTTQQRTELNQIDNMVRVQSKFSGNFYSELGSYFYIECKNENSTPKGGYASKLHSITHGTKSKFAVFVSIHTAPSTFKGSAYHYFLQDRIVMVSYDLNELKQLIFERRNLLESLERKWAEITTNSRMDLYEIGLYDA